MPAATPSLTDACKALDLDGVRAALAAGAHPNETDEEGCPALICAMRAFINVDRYDDETHVLATSQRQHEICKVLLAAGSKTTWHDTDNQVYYSGLEMVIDLAIERARTIHQWQLETETQRLEDWLSAGVNPNDKVFNNGKLGGLHDSMAWTLYNVWNDDMLSDVQVDRIERLVRDTLVLLVHHGADWTAADIDQTDLSDSDLIDGSRILLAARTLGEQQAMERDTAMPRGSRRGARL